MNYWRVLLLDAFLVFLSNLIFHASANCGISDISLIVNNERIHKETYYVNFVNFNDNVTVSCSQSVGSRLCNIALQLDLSSSTFNLERGSVTMSKDNFVPGTYQCKDSSRSKKVILRRKYCMYVHVMMTAIMLIHYLHDIFDNTLSLLMLIDSLGAPTLVVSSPVLRAYKGQTVMLPCKLDNVYRSVTYKVCWTKQDKRLEKSCMTKPGDKIDISTFSLPLGNVSSDHVGAYKCQVEEIGGDAMSGKYIISSPVVLQVSGTLQLHGYLT